MGTGTCPSTFPSEVDAHVPVRVESNAIPEISIDQRFPKKTNPILARTKSVQIVRRYLA